MMNACFCRRIQSTNNDQDSWNGNNNTNNGTGSKTSFSSSEVTSINISTAYWVIIFINLNCISDFTMMILTRADEVDWVCSLVNGFEKEFVSYSKTFSFF